MEILICLIMLLTLVNTVFLVASATMLVRIVNFLASLPTPQKRRRPQAQPQPGQAPIVPPPNLMDLPPAVPYHLPQPENDS
jgi:hypothetical protein